MLIIRSGCNEIKVPGEDASYWLYHSGPVDNCGLHGVAIVVDAMAHAALMSQEAVSPRIMVMRFRKPVDLSVVSVYAPTLPSDDEDKDALYEDLQQVINKIPRRDVLIVASDWNARTGGADATTQRIVGKFGLGVPHGDLRPLRLPGHKQITLPLAIDGVVASKIAALTGRLT